MPGACRATASDVSPGRAFFWLRRLCRRLRCRCRGPVAKTLREKPVEHPRTDPYGLPDVALTRGLLEWLHEEQALATVCPEDFELYSYDSGDDSPSFCILEVRLPRQLDIH